MVSHPKSFFIETFGCQMNQLDSEKVAGQLSSRGFVPVASAEEADIILLNTCAIRDKAIQKVYSRLGDLKHKVQGRAAIIGVLGCGAQMEGENFIKKAPVDIVAGPQKVYKIPLLVEEVLARGKPVVDVVEESDPVPAEVDEVLRESSFRAMVTIMEGCDNSCTFCVVPHTRGRARHRPSQRILEEVRALAEKGYSEIVLLGQNVNAYRDPSEAGLSFAGLLRAVGSVAGIKRVRFTSPHPHDFTPDVIEAINEVQTLCNQVHMPAQSGSTRVLELMKRGYTREEYLAKVAMVKASPRNIALSTDLIVGFPGETEEDFEQTLTLLEEVRYDQVFSFKYSPRPFTAAVSFGDPVPEQEKGRRLMVLQELQRKIQEERNRRFIGKRVEVLVESFARAKYSLTGRTTENKIVNFDGARELIGSYVWVEVTGCGANSLQGVLLGR